jgi:hypothetical protein
MDEKQIERIAKMLYRISDSQERDEVTRGIADVLEAAVSGFDRKGFYRQANVAYLEER